MVYMLVEIRGIVPPVLTEIKSIEVDDLFLSGLDEETEMLVRSDGLSLEIYNVNNNEWESLETV